MFTTVLPSVLHSYAEEAEALRRRSGWEGGGGNIEMETLSQPFTFERRQGSQSRREDNLSRGYKLEISNETLSARGSAIENTLVFVIFELLYVHGTIKYTKSNKLNCSVSCTVI